MSLNRDKKIERAFKHMNYSGLSGSTRCSKCCKELDIRLINNYQADKDYTCLDCFEKTVKEKYANDKRTRDILLMTIKGMKELTKLRMKELKINETID